MTNTMPFLDIGNISTDLASCNHTMTNTTFCGTESPGDTDGPTPSAFAQSFRYVINRMEVYWNPIVILLGIVGNTTSLVVFVLSPLRRMSWSVYLAALAVSDSGFLLVLLASWANHVGVNIYHTWGWCQSLTYVTYVSAFLSVWYVVAFTTERYIVVCFPLRRIHVTSLTRSKLVVAGLTAFAVIAYSFALWTSGLQHMHGSAHFCSHLMKYNSLLYVLTYIDTIATLVVPFIAIVLLNSSIMYTVVCYHTWWQSTVIGQVDDRLSVTNMSDTTLSEPVTSVNIRGHRRARLKGTRDSVMRMTKTLVVVSSVFILLNFPSHAIKSYMFVAELADPLYMPSHVLQTCLKLAQLVYNVNFAINFLLYSACGSTFRQALRSLSIQMNNKIRGSKEAYLNNKETDVLPTMRATRLQSQTMTTEVPLRVIAI